MVFERNDIRLSPRWPWMIFGDGYFAQIPSIVPAKNVEGKDVWRLVVLPTEELAKKHNITSDLLDENGTIKAEYPKSMIISLSADPSWPVYFCFYNFRGQPVESTDVMLGKIQTDKIMGLMSINSMLRSEIAYLMEQLEKTKSNLSRYIREEIAGPAAELSAQFFNPATSPTATAKQY